MLPGIEITIHEGAHIIAIFDEDFDETQQILFLGAIGLPVDGSERNVVKEITLTSILMEITDKGGITVVPHPFTQAIGLLDSARKIPTKMAWLESGNLGLVQIDPDKVRYIAYDGDAKWQNRYVLSSSPKRIISSTDYSLAPIVQGEAGSPDEIESGATWIKVGRKNVAGLRQVTCEPRTRIRSDRPPRLKSNCLLGLSVEGGAFNGLVISFSSELNCIIGENHSGKSAIFDFVSFALRREETLGTKKNQ